MFLPESLSRPITSDWQRLEVGIITGCPISVILFALAINMLVKSAEATYTCKSKSGICQPPIWWLKRVMGWARMSVKLCFSISEDLCEESEGWLEDADRMGAFRESSRRGSTSTGLCQGLFYGHCSSKSS